MRAFLGKQLRALWEIALVVFGPAKNAPRVLSWWPIVVAVLGVALPVIGLGVPGDFAFDPASWVVIALAVLLLLCFRALWILHAAVARDFPRAEIDVKPSIAIHRDDPEIDMDDTLLFFDVRVTNRESSHRLNLVFDMSLRWTYRDHFFSYKLYPARDERLTDRIKEPLTVEPQDTVEGKLIYTWDYSTVPEDEDRYIDFTGHMFRAKRDGSQFQLTVQDYVSDGSITMSCPGTWSSPQSRRVQKGKSKK